MMESLAQSDFGQIAALILLASAIGFVGTIFRQPLIVSFIAVGLIAGPSALDIVQADDQIALLSQLGIAVLLFLVGIKLDVKLIRSVGLVSLMTGLGQVVFTAVIGFGIGLVLGFRALPSLYIAIALTFSSTIIIVKLLSDKREIDTLHGQIALGFLIVQDLVVVFAMVALSAVGVGLSEQADGRSMIFLLAASSVLVAAVAIYIRYFANWLTERLAYTPELLIIFAIGQAATFAALADYIGLGKELGGLLAGVSLASTPYRELIAARLSPLRDFLLLFFFIDLGAALDLSQIGEHMVAAAVFSVFVLIGNPLIVLVIMGAMGFRKRTGFLAGLTVAQISEFSLLFVAMGVAIGHVQTDALGLVTLVGLVTIAVSTYMITYSHQLYALCEPALGIFEKSSATEPDSESFSRGDYDVVLLGLGRFGTALGVRLMDNGMRVLGIDAHPGAVRQWRAQGFDAEFGDATDMDFVSSLPLGRAKWVVSTIPDYNIGVTHPDGRRMVVQALRAAGFRGRIAVTSRDLKDREEIAATGADTVLEPFGDAACAAAKLLLNKEGSDTPDVLDPVSESRETPP